MHFLLGFFGSAKYRTPSHCYCLTNKNKLILISSQCCNVSHIAFEVGNYLLTRLHVISVKYAALFIHIIREQSELNCMCIQRSSTNLSRSWMISYQEVVLHCVVHQELRETRKKLSKRETFNTVTKKVKIEREGNQNKSWLELYTESWSGKTEQIKVTGNKVLLINRNREERDIKTWRLMQKKCNSGQRLWENVGERKFRECLM